jgi:prephenate dehydrogenase
MKHLDCVAIVGVGLVGGSIGMALRKRGLAERVIGIGRRQVTLRIARRVGAVTNTTIDLAKGVAEAELVVVCTPVGQIVEHVRQAAEHAPEGTLVTDVGSTKQKIVAELDGSLPRGCRFLGSHPLAGSERSGPSHADPELFEGRVALVTPTANTTGEDFDQVEALWEGLGSVVIKMPPEEHDRALSLTSHLPHLAAAALAATVPETLYRISGAGLRDTTRLAAGDPRLWLAIAEHNRDHVLTALEQYGRQLAALHGAIRDGDRTRLEKLLALAKKNRDALGS